MKKYEAIGVIETQYFPVATEILDHVCKAANIEFLSSEKYLGGRLVSLIIGGSIADVSEAVRVAEQVGESKQGSPLKKAIVITNPHEEILRYIISPKEKVKGKKRSKNTIKTKKTTAKKKSEEDNTNE
ncbi:BMC domain-containing protein [Pseudogracilibacillus sp. SE30717A]|uniref:BMC domain-containing protein n=1 Tax=Pseudogracilibacillus sp. SE30717A TaxID=3098293 RepID=UPI00300E29EA